MTRFYFVRHGDAYDEEGVQLDDYPLNNFGRLQALQLAKRLKTNEFSAMYCSKIRRSMETCEIVNDPHDMEVHFTPSLNEVGSDTWPQPGFISDKASDIEAFKETSDKIYLTFQKFYEKHKGEEVIFFTHGNWIRVLLAKILGHGDPNAFVHFVIHNTSLTIVDIDDDGFEHIISVSDAAHTQLYESRI